MVLLHKEQIEEKKNHHSIVRKSQIINKKEKDRLTTDENQDDEEQNQTSVVLKSKIISEKEK